MLIPYATDAPLYHRPYGTAAMILINTLTYFLMLEGAWRKRICGSSLVDCLRPKRGIPVPR